MTVAARYRLIFALLFAISGSAALLPVAQAQSQYASPRLDEAFATLKTAQTEQAAQAAADAIWILWLNPPDPELARRMGDVIALRQTGDFPAILALLDQLVVDYPDYAEAWNQRATVYFLLGNYERSLADIAKVLEFEPRHFGALAGRAVIYKTQGKQDLALQDMIAALAIHPFLVERALFPELQDMIAI